MSVTVTTPARSGVSNPLAGMLLFIVAEVMFFAGLVSAYVISRAGAYAWPPAAQPRLPVEVTAVNTLVLLASAAAMVQAGRRHERPGGEGEALRRLYATIGLGGCFVAVQGFEWVRLIGFGLTMTSSAYGSFFYLIVGAHALHVAAALAALVWAASALRRGALAPDSFQALRAFWYFVVGLWPVLYGIVYLA